MALVFSLTRLINPLLLVQAETRGLHPPYLGALECIYLTRHLTVYGPMHALSGGAGPFPNHLPEMKILRRLAGGFGETIDSE